jgi:hypothetical protein
MSNSRAERIARDNAARKRRRARKECQFLCTLRRYARLHRLRKQRKRRNLKHSH